MSSDVIRFSSQHTFKNKGCFINAVTLSAL